MPSTTRPRSGSSPPATSRAPPISPTATPAPAVAPASRSWCPVWASTTPAPAWRPRSRRPPPSCSSRARSTGPASASTSACCTRSTTSSTSCAPITEWQRRALEASEIADTVHEAFVHVQRGRRQPVEIEMPPEAFSESAEITLCAPAERVRVAADPDEIARAADLLVGAERPVVWVGGGVVLGDATDGAGRAGRVPPGGGGHHPTGQGRVRRPPSALRRHGVGEQAAAAAARRRRRRPRGRHPPHRPRAAGRDAGRPRRRRPRPRSASTARTPLAGRR